MFMPRAATMPLFRAWIGQIVAISLSMIGCVSPCLAKTNVTSVTASFYTINSAIRENTCSDAAHRRCLQANGKELEDEAYTAASWNYKMGTKLIVCRAEPVAQVAHGRVGKSDRQRRPRLSQPPCTTVVVSDRGPAKRLVRQGRVIDLSQAAFAALAPLSQGVIQVTVRQGAHTDTHTRPSHAGDTIPGRPFPRH